MSSQPNSLRPQDVGVALQLALTPEAPFRELARGTGLSLGEVHNAVQRLQIARLVLSHRRAVNRTNLVEFLVHGLPYVFAANPGPERQGVPTAHSAPALRDEIASDDWIVWPSSGGDARGDSLGPLLPSAPDLAGSNPGLYRWLTLADALRIGRSRERAMAAKILKAEISRDSQGS